MSWPDLVNGAFELSGAYFVWLSVAKLRRERLVRGVAWQTTGFFAAWGLWNLFYYPSFTQWASAAGAGAVTFMNLWYVALLLRYRCAERRTLLACGVAAGRRAQLNRGQPGDEA